MTKQNPKSMLLPQKEAVESVTKNATSIMMNNLDALLFNLHISTRLLTEVWRNSHFDPPMSKRTLSILLDTSAITANGVSNLHKQFVAWAKFTYPDLYSQLTTDLK